MKEVGLPKEIIFTLLPPGRFLERFVFPDITEIGLLGKKVCLDKIIENNGQISSKDNRGTTEN
jgi:hypothetical protein